MPYGATAMRFQPAVSPSSAVRVARCAGDVGAATGPRGRRARDADRRNHHPAAAVVDHARGAGREGRPAVGREDRAE